MGSVALALLVSGCLVSQRNIQDPVAWKRGITFGRDGCLATISHEPAAICRHTTDGWLLSNATLEGNGGKGLSGELYENLSLRNVTFRDFAQAIDVRVACACVVDVENVRATGPWTAASCLDAWPCDGQTGIMFRGPASVTISLRKVSMRGYATGIELHGLETEATPTNPGVWLPSPKLEAVDVNVECRAFGLWLQPSTQVSLEGGNVTGCSRYAVTAVNPENLLIRGSVFSKNALGVRFPGINSRTSQLTIEHSRFRENGVAVYSTISTTSVMNSTFSGNGGPTAPAPTDGRPRGGVFIGANGQVHGSSFEGNIGFGLNSTFTLIDAKNNWWGSPFGPRVATAAGPAGAGGDVVAGLVDYVPFLSSAP